jgi:protein TonB
MEPEAILYAHPLDLLFENRNKSYGAYILRKYYARRLLMSLGIILTGVIIMIFFYLHFQAQPSLTVRTFNVPDKYLADIQPPPRPESPPAKPRLSRSAASAQLTTPLITKDPGVPRPMATVEELRDVAIGLKTTAGEPDQGQLNASGNTAVSPAAGMDSLEIKEEIYDRAERMPEFPGGAEALNRFLLKNLRMPENELESGTRVRVIARFVVGADGRVRDVEITQAAEPSFNSEVKRVISKMPEWKPGEEHHRTVAVYFSLPVIFVTE